MPEASSIRNRALVWLIWLSLALGTLACYWPSRHYDYVNYDDWVYVYDNPIVERGVTWAGIKWALKSTEGGNWHPLVWISHMADCRIFGPTAGGHHLTNVLLHIANTLLLFGVLSAMTRTLWRSALVAALFAWHPMHVESVAWISERKDVLSTLFWLLAMWAYVRSVRSPAPGTKPRFKLALLFFALGLMSKAMLVTLPLILLVMDWWPLNRIGALPFGISGEAQCKIDDLDVKTTETKVSLAQAVREKIPFLVLSLVAGAIALGAQGAVEAIGRQGLFLRLENAAVSCVTYIALFFWPTNLTVYYRFPPHLALGRAAGAALVLIAITAGIVHFGRKRPYLPAGWLWFLIALLPVIGVVQVGIQAYADRYTYLPYIGLGLMVSWGLADFLTQGPWQRTVAISVASLGLAACLAATSLQLKYWQDSATLFQHAVDVAADNFLAHNNLGRTLITRGRTAEAIAHFRAAVAIKPDYSDAYFNLGLALQQQGNLGEAVTNYQMVAAIRPHYVQAELNLADCYLLLGRTDDAMNTLQFALQANPNSAEAHEYVGRTLLRIGRPGDAELQLEQAIKLDPGSAASYTALGNVRAAQGRTNGAAEMFSEAIRLDPANAEAHWNLGNLLLRMGDTSGGFAELKTVVDLRPDALDLRQGLADSLLRHGQPVEAQRHYEAVLQVAPKNAQAHFMLAMSLQQQKLFAAAAENFRAALSLKPGRPEYLDGLARLYATSPDASVRNGKDAVGLAEQACATATKPSPAMLDTLAAAYAEAGRFEEAIKTAGEARAAAEKARDVKFVEIENQRMQLYKANKAYHEEP